MDGRSNWAKMKLAVVKSSLAVYVGKYVTTTLPALITDYMRAIDKPSQQTDQRMHAAHITSIILGIVLAVD